MNTFSKKMISFETTEINMGLKNFLNDLSTQNIDSKILKKDITALFNLYNVINISRVSFNLICTF
jgi:hypothetical protein